MLELSDISKSWNRTSVLKNLSLKTQAGDSVLLLGANGAGKSTLLRICAGLTQADSGAITYSGTKPNSATKPKLAYLGHQLMLYGALTVRENLKLTISLTGSKETLDSLIEKWNLGSVQDKPVQQLSKGQQFRTALARSLASQPELILLDEPTSSLDDTSLELLLTRLEELKAKRNGNFCFVISTHDIQRLENCFSRVVLLKDGSIAADSSRVTCSSDVVPQDACNQVIAEYRRNNR